ncbi:putative transcription regulator mTERF family [Rosa chinensis]|uniref:Putative transcription regulator mTERF family n=1 Tax=Rosa chinensis TaxID=74649 RepID=A0A2P6R795_ROSCH|nr:putative transcription regulator mTERF family [Rosa chinensis]
MTKWGWSEDDVHSALKKFPQCMFKLEKKIMQTVDFLVNKMGLPSGIVVKFPQVMSVN